MSYSIVGTSVPRIDSFAKVLGQAQFIEDIVLPRMLHGKVLRSPYAHARILHVDTSRAERLPGVKGVVTGAEIPRRTFGIVPKAHDQLALEAEKVRYVGDSVAAVAAVDEDTALEALSLIDVEYEPLPAVFDPLEAMQPGAPLIHEVENNVSAQCIKNFGDVDRAFAESDYVREDKYYHQAVNHASIEPHGALALYDGRGKFTVWSNTQIPFFLRRNLAKTLGVPERDIRVIKPCLGGGFGGKIDMYTKDFAAAWLARKTGQPIRFIYSREEVFTSTRQRHPMILHMKTGLKKDGTITAQQCLLYADGGAYNSTAPLIVANAAYFIMMPYLVRNVRFEGYHVYTNKPVGGAMRGHGVPQVRFACDSSLDMIAQDAGLDPLDVRAKNALHTNDDHPARLRILSCGLTDAIEKLSASMQWQERWGKLPKGRGIGMSCSGSASGVSNMSHIGSGAIVKIQQDDGAVTLLTGAADIGQGAESVLCQIVAEVLGVTMAHMRVTAADTELTPLDPGTFGGGVTLRAGNAALKAAHDARGQIADIIADKLEANPEDLVFRDERVFVNGSPERGLSWNDAIKAVQYADRDMPIVGHGYYQPDVVEPTSLLTEEGNYSPAYSFLAQGAEVDVDLETGQVKVLRITTVHDCGYAINPMATDGQLEGSAIGGTGQAVYEDIDWEEGRIRNANFLDYRMPTALDVPDVVSIPVETNDPVGPFGAKEAGEGTQIPTACAITNAVYNAVGVRINELPITPEKILAALQRQRSRSSD